MEPAGRRVHLRRGCRGRRRIALTAGLAGASLVFAACAEPDPLEAEPEVGAVEEPIDETDERDALRDDVDVVHATLRHIEEALADARAAESLDAAHTAAELALTHLVVDGTAAGTADDDGDADADGEDDGGDTEADDQVAVAPLLPSETVERTQSVSAPDLLSATIAQAQDTGGELGRDVADVLRDPIAGDLGAWQRDAAGMVRLAEEVATSSDDLEALEPAILELEGEGTRALAWTFAVRGADDLELAQAAAERALAHVQVMRTAVEDLGGSS